MDVSALIGQFLPWLLAVAGGLVGFKFWTQFKKVVKYIGEFQDILAEIEKGRAAESEGGESITAGEWMKVLMQYNEFVVAIGKPGWKVKI